MSLLPLNDAIQAILDRVTTWGQEKVSLTDAYLKVLAEDIHADRDYPPFNRSAMDGYALRSSAWSAGRRTFSQKGVLQAGETFTEKLADGETLKIMTGAPVPEDLDVVIRREDARPDDGEVRFEDKEIKPWKNIARKGEDIKQGESLLEKGTLILPHIVSVLAVTGFAKVAVQKLPKVAIIGTGNELKDPGEPVEPHQIRDSNSYALTALFGQYGIQPLIRKKVVDTPEALKAAFEKAMEADIIVSTGAVSAGDADYVPAVLADLGVTKAFHKTRIKPGKPIWFGYKENKVFFALPGNPMSCQVGFKVFVEPFLRKSLGLPDHREFHLPFAGSRRKRTPFAQFFPVKLTEKRQELMLEPLCFKGSGDISAMIGSDGLAVHEAGSHEIQNGEKLRFIPWNIY